ncbi:MULTISPECIES: winged helix-turn-helix domain-containing protein [Achromobacter]|uniref:Winged helix family transcriptional regulator n=1 Tax=Alcaligenes xylosoxydans xylosoxydans TaxID=85698 RepID=A0A424W5L3_ALCXX|nr:MULTISPECIES: winged helix-turn-helix domain-containing protein [Achromobacter]MBC9907926.1 winged helix-turn-helix transcriptional regulator [Achromobacter xylosoxidans]MBD0872375.1 winged helix-turn-helix transcriptional regulator [Achromobacter xylosoxidans]MDH1300244.1 winged helix-turn-helix domain-containing protein [Achromobacter sp. GD03932]QNP88146.1 winged helix-turn-helix transcriptional regulator [Achromobacter xylosoxidans]RPJ88494.1 winged helix family transcriptional regulato
MAESSVINPPESSPRLQLADLELDLLRCRAYRGRQFLQLTPKEFGLLAFLMQRPGVVCVEWELAEQVWKMKLHIQDKRNFKSHAVAVAMRRLRRKVDAGPGPKLLHTMRGGSYMLAARPL